jgi:hypothetical protein
MAYIIDILTIHAESAQFDGPCHGADIPCAEQIWHGTYATLAEAEESYQTLSQAPHVLAAALVEWRPGKIEALPDQMPRTGNYSDRNCIGGIPTQTLLRHGHRSWTRYRYGDPGCMSKPRLYSETGDWQEQTDQIGVSLTTQPAPGHKLRAPQFGQDDQAIAA